MYTVVAQSPGRINLIGEHTDYNQGLVLPAAINKKSVFKLKMNNTADQVNIHAINMGESLAFNFTNMKPQKEGWQNYVMGVVSELTKLGAQIKGFDGEFEGDVPIGSGMSSSAALECSLAFGLNELFNLGFDRWQLIKASQMAEHNYVGIYCGIMDQFASMMGKQGQVILLDCKTLEHKYYPLDLQDYEILLINSNVTHALASSEYNNRRQDCIDGVTILQKKYKEIQSLRDVTMPMLDTVASDMSNQIYNRCHHVISENQRVLKSIEYIIQKDIPKLGEQIYQSHFSLRDDYEVSCQELDFLVQQTYDKEYIVGSRMMGGGFGGCTLNIIKKDKVQEFTDLILVEYKKHMNLDATPYSVSIGDGASLLETVS